MSRRCGPQQHPPMVSLVLAPPLWPFFAALVLRDLLAGLPSPASAAELSEAVLWTSAVAFGAASILWLSLLGMQRRKLLPLWPVIPLLPIYYLLTSIAAWMALYDLTLRPYHWHKTEHGLAKNLAAKDDRVEERNAFAEDQTQSDVRNR